ncbi:MAG: hypothetical protein AVDCRST_MAG93-504, partial [uncultured Chloroflexia bacterium]
PSRSPSSSSPFAVPRPPRASPRRVPQGAHSTNFYDLRASISRFLWRFKWPSNGLQMNHAHSVARVGWHGRAGAQPPGYTRSVREEAGATVYEKMPRNVTRLLEAALKWAGLTALMISCALLVYLGGVLLARLSAWVLFP